ncbi:GGDEF domain-containing protein [Photobacterium jeanii]|uniref:GGDEF domain-containing protein n=1 Tax=Photobacterium jeanii TaxID=858640 RepID=UPI00082A214C|nr:GGDEF domain-containing protein [Photobacterium jeanii]
MSQITLVILLLLVILTSPAQAAVEAVNLQLRWHHQAEFAGFYVAKEKGFYHEAGLDVTINQGGDGKSALHAVLSKKAHFGVGNTEVLVAYGHGQPLVALANIFQRSPNVLLMKADSPIYQLSDLSGKQIMMFAGNEDAEIIAMMAKAGLTLSDFEQVPTTGKLESLVQDHVDAFSGYLTSDAYILNQQGIPPRVFDPTDHGIYFYSDIIFTHSDMVEYNEDVVTGFREASLRGWEYALQHIPETLEILTHYPTGKSPAVLEQELLASRDMIMAELIELGHMNTTRWQHIADTLHQLKIIPPTVIDEQFLYPLQERQMWLTIKPWLNTAIISFFISVVGIGYCTWANRQLRKEIRRRKESEAKTALIARKDMLTGIPNRYAFLEHLHRTLKCQSIQHAAPALLFIDLDDFKQVNDNHGHHIGDKVLQQFCYRMNGLLGGNAFFARLAGDEFVMLITKTSTKEVDSLVDQIMIQARRPFVLNEYSITIGASVGVTYYRNGDTPDYFLSRADSQMYGNKKRSQQERFIENRVV